MTAYSDTDCRDTVKYNPVHYFIKNKPDLLYKIKIKMNNLNIFVICIDNQFIVVYDIACCNQNPDS